MGGWIKAGAWTFLVMGMGGSVVACGPGTVPVPSASATAPNAMEQNRSHGVAIASLPENAMGDWIALKEGFGCDRGIDVSPSWGQKTSAEILAWLATYGVSETGADLPQAYLAEFAAEFERIPEIFRKKAFAAGGLVHLLQGKGVAEDPSWPAAVSNTADGRAWLNVPGAGGFPYLHAWSAQYPTRFVINRLYEGHGSINLVLHEFAHSLDSLSKPFEVSSAPAWTALAQNDTAFRSAIGSWCNSYCTDQAKESFAESFAIYYTCDSTRQWLQKKAPAVADWMSTLATQIK